MQGWKLSPVWSSYQTPRLPTGYDAKINVRITANHSLYQVREFARWAPNLRVVPFYGEQKTREVIKKYELEHPVVSSGTTGAKYHILVSTYEAVTKSKEFSAVFKKNPRWEVLVVDEGQRCELRVCVPRVGDVLNCAQ